MAPELPTLIALDASLLAAIRLLEFQHPFFPEWGDDRYLADSVEEHIANSICVLATALRKSLSAYYAAIRENEHQWDEDEDEQEDVPF